MKKLYNLIPAILIPILILGTFIFAGGCSNSQKEGFAIYLTKNDISPFQMEMLSHVEIADKPVIGIKDIISYDAGTHEITLTDDAFERISELEVPVQGRSFVVCVDRAPIYWGAFWVGLSSQSFDGVTIWMPLRARDSPVIALTPGYPASSFYSGQDPRNNPTVMDSLEKSGKLINKPATSKLPHSFKGYELYSWVKNGSWYFTLITGTNRTKALEEIISGSNTDPGDGWVNIRVTGVNAVNAVLSRLPAGEDIAWLSEPRAIDVPENEVYFSLPDEIMTDAIKEQAAACGLNLWIL
jgi:hypothetical protein